MRGDGLALLGVEGGHGTAGVGREVCRSVRGHPLLVGLLVVVLLVLVVVVLPLLTLLLLLRLSVEMRFRAGVETRLCYVASTGIVRYTAR